MTRPSRECAIVAPMFTAHEGELTLDELSLLERHLAACEGCRLLAGEFRATEGIAGAALLAAADEVDFSRFADQVMERVRSAAPPERRPAPRAAVEGRSFWSHALAWARAHRAAAVAGTVAPTLAAAALIVYFATSGTPAFSLGEVEVVAEGRVPVVLQTSDGPVVLLDEPDET
jgi:anti-sigma factor RsiW